jgi:tryptophanyl-tRNA synthetase
MFTYPVLMAHDIAGYDKVIVGDDQKPHIEFANDILHRIGFTCPEPIYEGGRVMDLRHPEKKMSKSDPESCLFLNDPLEVMEKKIQKAVTDEAGRANLEFIYKSLGGKFPIPLRNDYLKKFVIDELKRHFHGG